MSLLFAVLNARDAIPFTIYKSGIIGSLGR